LYHYSTTRNWMERLPTPPEAADRPPWWDPETPLPDVDLVIMSDVARVFAKYGGRGFTYCLLDAGLLAHRIDLLAQRLQVRVRLAWNFDDPPVSALLGLESPERVPTCVIGLGG
jgi:hypothetical protein